MDISRKSRFLPCIPLSSSTAWVGWHNIFLVRQVLAHRRLNFMITLRLVHWPGNYDYAVQHNQSISYTTWEPMKPYFLHIFVTCLAAVFRLIKTGGCLVELHGISVLMNEPSAPLCQDLQAPVGFVRLVVVGQFRWVVGGGFRWLGELNQESYESVAPSERKSVV